MNLTVATESAAREEALFAQLGAGGGIEYLAGTNANSLPGGLVGSNAGTTSNSSASGGGSTAGFFAGGLAASNDGMIFRSFATGNMTCGIGCEAGGLVGENGDGDIDQSYAAGNVSGEGLSFIGGLVGVTLDDFSTNSISNCYATGAVTATGSTSTGPRIGGLIGINDTTHVATSYATGAPTFTGTGAAPLIGGFVGEHASTAPANFADYWNKTTSGITDPSQGAGSPANEPGITGLTGAQMRAGLPAGFDSAIWAEAPG